jgi:hypothetical protein
MDVDEPGRDDQPARIKDVVRVRSVEVWNHRSDRVALDADVGKEPRVACAIDDASAANQEIERRRLRGRTDLCDEGTSQDE